MYELASIKMIHDVYRIIRYKVIFFIIIIII
jgi:hypothetical protein